MPERPDWQLEAPCRGVGPDRCFDLDRRQQVLFIRTFCDICTVKVDCARARHGCDGVWGGHYFPQRGNTATLAPPPAPRQVLPETDQLKHGTRAMYVKGCGCEDCGTAEREYGQRRRARQRNQRAQAAKRATA